MNMSPDVIEVIPNKDYTLTVTFDNGEIKIFDVKPYLERGIYVALKNPVYFQTVSVIAGTVSWNDKQDFCPDTVYLESKEV
jgi:hypothetical protein